MSKVLDVDEVGRKPVEAAAAAEGFAFVLKSVAAVPVVLEVVPVLAVLWVGFGEYVGGEGSKEDVLSADELEISCYELASASAVHTQTAHARCKWRRRWVANGEGESALFNADAA
ncbi:hypothetical protein EVG20_g8002 [Dentipellis fragilis]|uniref:Uncharacterized protein n=1 Tax=Dentipellis fragilis TaxID=205917 RepID=A0A4Y9Y8I1_9AGAM|nr:hypothetical protein EVG20_g8002 [Dentipellis fragilis]